MKCSCSRLTSQAGRFRKGAQVYHLLPSNAPVIALKTLAWWTPINGQWGSHGWGYVGTFILCKSAVAPTAYFHTHCSAVASFLHNPMSPAPELRRPYDGLHRDLICLKTKPTKEDYFSPEEDPAFCVSWRRGSLYKHSHAHSPVDTFLFLIYSQHRFKYPELLIWILFQTGFIILYQVLVWTHSLHKNWPCFHILKLFSWCILKSHPKLIWIKFPECTRVDKQ